jgi:hypothetical protein
VFVRQQGRFKWKQTEGKFDLHASTKRSTKFRYVRGDGLELKKYKLGEVTYRNYNQCLGIVKSKELAAYFSIESISVCLL